MSWTQQEAINMCVLIEQVIPAHGAHIALTGGSLYKTGPRKDADVLFYRIRQWKRIEMQEMWEALEKIGFVKLSGFGWCYKATFNGKPVDCFFPESARDENGDEIEYGQKAVDEFAALSEPEDEEILF